MPVARSIGGPAVRNMGTVGGNLFAPAPFGDFARRAARAGRHGFRSKAATAHATCPMEEFFAARERAAGTLVLSASPASGLLSAEAFRYRKISRIKPKGGSVITLAVARLPIAVDACSGARIAFGPWAPTPIRAKSAERALGGQDARCVRDRRRRRGCGRRELRLPTTRSPAPGIAAKSSASICAACCGPGSEGSKPWPKPLYSSVTTAATSPSSSKAAQSPGGAARVVGDH